MMDNKKETNARQWSTITSVTVRKPKIRVRDEAWVAVMVGFVALEAAAILNPNESSTASQVIRRAAGISPRTRWRPLGAAAIIGFSVWLAAHLINDPNKIELEITDAI